MLKTVIVMFWGPKMSALMVPATRGNMYKHKGWKVYDAVFLAQAAAIASFANSAQYLSIELDSHHAPNISIIDHPHCAKRLQSLSIIYASFDVCLITVLMS